MQRSSLREGFVGRQVEVSALREAWERCVDGEAQLGLFSGEPGIGKTRLTTEFSAEVANTGGVVLPGRCEEEGIIPYQPFIEAIRHWLARPLIDGSTDGDGSLVPFPLSRLLPELGKSAGQGAGGDAGGER